MLPSTATQARGLSLGERQLRIQPGLHISVLQGIVHLPAGQVLDSPARAAVHLLTLFSMPQVCNTRSIQLLLAHTLLQL